MIHGNDEAVESHVGSQSAGTIKLNFINWILRRHVGVAVRAASRCNKTGADNFFERHARRIRKTFVRILLQIVRATVLQAEYEGSIPFTRSNAKTIARRHAFASLTISGRAFQCFEKNRPIPESVVEIDRDGATG